MWRESSPQQYITTHHDCELHGRDCARPWLQIAVELLRQGVHDRVLCSYHLACCQLRLMRWCPMWWWNPPENSRKYPEIFKKNAITYIFRRMNTLFSTLFSAVFIALQHVAKGDLGAGSDPWCLQIGFAVESKKVIYWGHSCEYQHFLGEMLWFYRA